MPAIVISAVVTWALNASVATVILTTLASTISYVQQRRAERRAKEAYNDSLRDRLVTTATVDGSRSRIYGQVRTSDGVLFKATRGDKSQFYTLIIGVAGHEVDAIPTVYFGDQAVALDAAGWVQTAPWSGAKRDAGGVWRGDLVGATSTMDVVGGVGSVVLPTAPEPYTVFVGLGGEYVPAVVDGTLVSVSGVSFGLGPYTGQLTVHYQAEASFYGLPTKARVRKYLGGPGQDLSASLGADFPGLITAAHKFAGIALLRVDLEYDQDAFPQGVPNITALVRGAKVWDPRTGLTAWSNNPALCALDWALYAQGCNGQLGDIELASFIAAANACDLTHAFPVVNQLGATVTTNMPLFTCGLAARTDVDPLETLDQLVAAMAGRRVWAGGQLRVRAGVYRAPVATITEDWCSGQGDIELVSSLPRTELFNVVRPTIADAAQQYVAVRIGEVVAEAYLASDGVELPLDVTLAAVTDVAHAQHVCGVMLREARQGLVVKLPCNLRAYPLEVYDCVNLTLPRFGFAAKLFEVLGWEFSLEGGVVLTLRETDAGVFDPAAEFTATDPAPNTQLPDPFGVRQLVLNAPASGTAQLLKQADGTIVTRMLVTWPEIADEAVRNGGAVELRFGLAGTDPATWQTATVPGTETRAWLTPVQDGGYYIVQGRARNKLVAGRWSAQVAHVVVGKSAPPAAPTGLQAVQAPGGALVTWDACTEADYLDSALRVGATFAEAELVWQGAASAYLWAHAAAGDFKFWLQHRDTSGNVGAAVSAIVTLAAPQPNLAATAVAFTFDADDEAAPAAQAVVFTLSTNGIVGAPVWSAQIFDAAGDSLGAAVLTGAGLSRTLSVADFGAAARAVVTVTVGGATATATVVRVRDGAPGQAGPGLLVQYSVNGAWGWHADFVDGDFYMRQSVDAGHTWSAPIRIVGRNGDAGAPGGYVDYVFKRSAAVPDAPVGDGLPAGWSGAPPAGTNPLYMSRAAKNADGSLQAGASWSTPARLDGLGVLVQYSVSGAGGWHTDFAAGDVYMRQSVDGGATWSAAIRIVGEQGPQGPAGASAALGKPLDAWVLNGHALVNLGDGVVGSVALRLAGLGGTYPNQGSLVAIDPTRTYRVRFWARPSAATAGLLYFSLRQFIDSAGTPGPGNGGRAPYKPSGVSRADHVAQFGATWGQYVYDWTATDWQVGAKFVLPEFLDNYNGAAGYWDIQGFEFFDVTEAAAANAELAKIAADDWLSKDEKPAAILDWQAISGEQAGLDARATAFGIVAEKNAYDTAITQLAAYLGGLAPQWDDITQHTPIVGATFRAKFAAVYTAKQALVNKFAEIAATLASWANITGTGKPVDGATRNNVTYGPTQPAIAGDGDLWCKTSSNPVTWYVCVGGTWLVAANLVTGTGQISDTAGLGQTALWGGVSNRPKSFRAASVGGSCYSPPLSAGLYNAENLTLLAGPARSYLVAAIRRSDGVLTWARNYDVYGGGAAGGYNAYSMVADLNAMGSESIVIVIGYDEPQNNRLTSGLAAAMYRHGASRAVFGSPDFRYRSSYVLVGIGGCGEANGFEAYQGAIDSDSQAWCDVTFLLLNGSLIVTGAGASPRSLADYGYVMTDNLDPASVTDVTVFTDGSGASYSNFG